MVIDADGRIVLAGLVGDSNPFGEIALARLTPDGLVDTSFGTGGTALVSLDPSLRASARSLRIDRDGKLVVAGAIGAVSGDYTNMAALRFLPDGTLDASFGTGGIATVGFNLVGDGSSQDFAEHIVEQADSRLVMVGSAEYGDMGFREAVAARLMPDGQLDDTFGIGGKVAFDFQLAFQSDQTFFGATLQNDRVVALGRAIEKGLLNPQVDISCGSRRI